MAKSRRRYMTLNTISPDILWVRSKSRRCIVGEGGAAPTPTTYPALIQSDVPAVYCRFGEPLGGSLVAVDISGNSNNGAYHGPGIDLGEPGAISGDSDTSVRFNPASPDWVDIPLSASLTLGSAHSMECWIKFEGLDSFQCLFARQGYQLVLWHTSTANPGKIVFEAPGGVLILAISTIPMVAMVWTHVVATFDLGVASKLYFNGADVTSPGSTSAIGALGPGPITIGRTLSGGASLAGWMDEPALYNYVLTPADVQAHHRAGLSPYARMILAANPVGYWRFSEPSGTTAVDLSGNNLNGVYQNAPTLGVDGAIAGDTDKAVTMNGTTQWISVAANPLLALGGSTFTLEAWVRILSTSTEADVIIGFSTFFWYIEGTASYLAVWKLGPPVPLIVRTSIVFPTDVWVHTVLTVSGTDLRLYINGVDYTLVLEPGVPLTTATDFMDIGQYTGGGGRLAGSIDEVTIYDRALTPAEVLAHRNQGIGA